MRSEAPGAAESPVRARILAASRQRFADFGYRRTGIAEIARDAGIAPGTVYRYFANKEKVFRAVMRHGLAQWLATARRVLTAPGTAVERLARLAQASLDFSRAERVNRSFIPADLRKQESDLIFSVPWRGAQARLAREVWVYVLLEHQSRPDLTH